MDNFSKLDLAWMAGFFDGEGAIFVFHLKPRKGNPLGEYVLEITIGQTDRNVLEYFMKFGGTIRVTHKAGGQGHPNQRTAYRWDACGVNAITFLSAVAPYLRFKHAIALKAIEFGQTFTKHGGRRQGKVVTVELLIHRQAICEEIWSMQPNRMKVDNSTSATRQPLAYCSVVVDSHD